MSATASRGDQVVGVSVAFLVVAVLLTIVRFLTRILIVRNFGPEDWTIGAATILALAMTVCMGEQVQFGLGKHITDIPHEDVLNSLKPFWASVWIYQMSLAFTKLSILFQYYRIIIYEKTRLAIYVTMGLVICYGIATFFDSIFLCVPVDAFWTSNRTHGVCTNENIVWYANSSVNIVLDVIIVILPMHAIKSLAISRGRKIGVMFLFALGGFVTITSIVRLYTLKTIANSNDPTWDNVEAAIWSCVEVNVGIACACLPAIRPLVSHIRGTRPSDSSYYVRNQGDELEMPLSPTSYSFPRHPSQFGSVAFANDGPRSPGVRSALQHSSVPYNRTPSLPSPGKSTFLASQSTVAGEK